MRITLAFASALALAPASSTAAPGAPHSVKSPMPVAADEAEYAQREARDKAVASFEGGSVVVIGISGGALLVLLLLLII